MADFDRRTVLGGVTLAGAAIAGSAQAAPAILAMGDLKKEADSAALYHCDFGDPPRFMQMLTNISNHYSAYGNDPFAVQLAIVAHGQGVKFFLETLDGTTWKDEAMVPQIFPRVADLSKNGLNVYLCNITFERLKLDREKVHKRDFIHFVPSGVATVGAMQNKGFAYIKIG